MGSHGRFAVAFAACTACSSRCAGCSCSGPLRVGANSLWCFGRSFIRPVLKHGPRSLTCARVMGFYETQRRSEGKGRVSAAEVGSGSNGRRTTGSFHLFSKGRRKSVHAGTRKMVNYACAGRSQRKLWWRTAAFLTCKSIVKREYRGERLIEPSSSWFPPKFPSG